MALNLKKTAVGKAAEASNGSKPLKQLATLDKITASSLRDTSFTLEEDEVKQRLIVAIDGETGSGKNKMAFSFPDPIAFMSFDPNYVKTLREAQALGKVIFKARYDVPVVKPDGKDGAHIASVCGEVWDKFAVDYIGALRDDEVNTVIIDTASELYELIVYAIYGKNVQIMPRERGHAYATYRQVLREAEFSNKNLVLIHKMKDEWVNDKSTGRRIRAGYKDTNYSVTTEILMQKDINEPFPERYHALITKCHDNPAIEYDGAGNGELVGEAINFDVLRQMVWGE